ncbi:DUF6053 domain-containing protein [Lysobacter enzymogenes]
MAAIGPESIGPEGPPTTATAPHRGEQDFQPRPAPRAPG